LVSWARAATERVIAIASNKVFFIIPPEVIELIRSFTRAQTKAKNNHGLLRKTKPALAGRLRGRNG